jgi:hypothetical protein
MDDAIFLSKVDMWLVGVPIAVWLLSTLISYALVKANANLKGLILILYGLTLVPIMAVFLWAFVATKYEFKGATLLVHPLNTRIDIGSIKSVTPTRNARSSPALSLDRLEIRYGEDRTILISPREKDQFIAELTRRRNAIQSGTLR